MERYPPRDDKVFDISQNHLPRFMRPLVHERLGSVLFVRVEDLVRERKHGTADEEPSELSLWRGKGGGAGRKEEREGNCETILIITVSP